MIELGRQISEWSIESISDSEVPTLESYRGKPLLILFFNLGCPGCKGRALPFANWVNIEYKDKINVLGFINYGAGGTPHWILVDENTNLNYSIFGSDPNNALLRLDLKIQELTK